LPQETAAKLQKLKAKTTDDLADRRIFLEKMGKSHLAQHLDTE